MIRLATPGALAALTFRCAQLDARPHVHARRLPPERREQRRELVDDVLRGLSWRNGKRIGEIVAALRDSDAVARAGREHQQQGGERRGRHHAIDHGVVASPAQFRPYDWKAAWGAFV